MNACAGFGQLLFFVVLRSHFFRILQLSSILLFLADFASGVPQSATLLYWIFEEAHRT
jgi:hypothetical protein